MASCMRFILKYFIFVQAANGELVSTARFGTDSSSSANLALTQSLPILDKVTFLHIYIFLNLCIFKLHWRIYILVNLIAVR